MAPNDILQELSTRMLHNASSLNKKAGSVRTIDTDQSWSDSEQSSVYSQTLEEASFGDQNTVSVPVLEDGSIASVGSVQAESILNYTDRLMEDFNQLPGGLLKTSALRFLVLSVPAISFDWLYCVFKAGWFYNPIEEAWQDSGDMALSSTVGAFLLVFLLTASNRLGSQLTPIDKTWMFNVLTPMVNNALGAGLRAGLATVNHDSMQVGPGEAVYGVLLGEIFTFIAIASVLATMIGALYALMVPVYVVETVRQCIAPSSRLNETALQSLGQSSQIAGFAEERPDIELAIIPSSNRTVQIGDTLSL
jgi:hypothetical protein